MSNRQEWPHDLDGLQELALEEILPKWRATTDRPDRSYPTIAWLEEHRYSHLRWILDHKHKINTERFFTSICGCEESNGYWNISDAKTIREAESFLESKKVDRRWAENTAAAKRSQLNRVFATYESIAGAEKLVDIANSPEQKTRAYENFERVIRQIRSEAASDSSAYKYLRTAQRFFSYLERRYKIEYNPTAELQEEFNLDLDEDGSEPLSPRQVGRLWAVADTLEEYMLVIGYVMWGVRRKELPSIHKSQFVIDGNELKIHFEETDRKNGEGTVTVLFGVDYILELLSRHEKKRNWNGHLLVSPDNPGASMSSDMAKSRFVELCERADIEIDGETPTPVNGRAAWMDLQSRAGAMHAEIMMDQISLQGSVDPESAINYTSDETKEQYRQLLFLRELKSVLPEDAYEDEFVFTSDLEIETEVDKLVRQNRTMDDF